MALVMSEFGIIYASRREGLEGSSQSFFDAWLKVSSFDEWWLVEQKKMEFEVPFVFLGTAFDYSKLNQFFEAKDLEIGFYELTEGSFYELLAGEKYRDKSFMLSLLAKADESNRVFLDSDREELSADFTANVSISLKDIFSESAIGGIRLGSNRKDIERRVGMPKSWVVDLEHARRDKAQTWVYDGLQVVFDADLVSGWCLQINDDSGCLNIDDPDGFLNSLVGEAELCGEQLIPLSEAFPNDRRLRRKKNTFVLPSNRDVRVVYSNDGRLYKISLLPD